MGGNFEEFLRKHFSRHSSSKPAGKKRNHVDKIYINNKMSKIHPIVAKSPIFPCIEVIEWIINHSNTVGMEFKYCFGKVIFNFIRDSIVWYYILLENLEKSSTNEFIKGFHEKFDVRNVLETWWSKDKRRVQRQDGIYPMSGLREPYQYLMGLFCTMYGLKGCIIFRDSWIPMEYAMAIYSWNFSWGTILSNTIIVTLKKSKENPTKLARTFFMSSYLLDYICAFINFPSMDWDENDSLLIYMVC